MTSSQIPAFEPEVDSGLDPSLPGHDPAEPLQRAFHRVRMARSLPESILVPAVGTIAIAAMASEPLESGALALLVFLCASFIVPERPPWATLLPLMRGPLQLLVPLIGTFAVGVMQAITGVPGISLSELAIVFAAASVASLLPWATARRPWSNHAQVRIAVIGSQRSTDDLARELRLAGIPDYLVVGRISVTEPPGEDPTEEVPRLGSLDDLGAIVREQGIQLLVMSSEAPRFLVFDEVSRSCLQLPVRLWELSAFYEDVFGHVAVAEINSAWFQYIMHPKYRRVAPASKRALDIMIAAVAGLLFLPLLALFAPLIARDGGSVFFYQTRIGEGGRPLRLIKLRTMRNSDSAGPQWATDGDDRITPIGRFLRRTHLDEMPQLLNVLKGEMSLVGPRPGAAGVRRAARGRRCPSTSAATCSSRASRAGRRSAAATPAPTSARPGSSRTTSTTSSTARWASTSRSCSRPSAPCSPTAATRSSPSGCPSSTGTIRSSRSSPSSRPRRAAPLRARPLRRLAPSAPAQAALERRSARLLGSRALVNAVLQLERRSAPCFSGRGAMPHDAAQDEAGAAEQHAHQHQDAEVGTGERQAGLVALDGDGLGGRLGNRRSGLLSGRRRAAAVDVAEHGRLVVALLGRLSRRDRGHRHEREYTQRKHHGDLLRANQSFLPP